MSGLLRCIYWESVYFELLQGTLECEYAYLALLFNMEEHMKLRLNLASQLMHMLSDSKGGGFDAEQDMID